MTHRYYSQRKGTNPNQPGFSLKDTIDLFRRTFDKLEEEGYFDEAFGFYCPDQGMIEGEISEIEMELLLTVRKKDLWPISNFSFLYTEDDFFDVIEFLFQHVSKPIEGVRHNSNNCGMHWELFNKVEGQIYYRKNINEILNLYVNSFELSKTGEVLQKPEVGFDVIFEADVPTEDESVTSRVNSAIIQFRRHGASIDDRRLAVGELADVLEYLRPEIKLLFTSDDEKALFNIANNFGIRHHNQQQKTNYDASIWLSWMFYFYLQLFMYCFEKLRLRESK